MMMKKKKNILAKFEWNFEEKSFNLCLRLGIVDFTLIEFEEIAKWTFQKFSFELFGFL